MNRCREVQGISGTRHRIRRRLEELDREIRDCLEDIRQTLRELEKSGKENPGNPLQPSSREARR